MRMRTYLTIHLRRKNREERTEITFKNLFSLRSLLCSKKTYSNILTIILLCCFTTTIVAQRTYEEAIGKGDIALKRQQFKEAINFYFAAEAFDPSKREVARAKINHVFDEIETLKKTAENLAKTSQLAAVAIQAQKENPVLAMHLANYAYQYSEGKNELAYKLRLNAYSDLENRIITRFKTTNFIKCIAISPDGKSILTGNFDKTAILWDLNGQQKQVFKGHEHDIFDVAFSPDGKSVLTGSRDKTAILWDLNGQQKQVFKGHTNFIRSVAFLVCEG